MKKGTAINHEEQGYRRRRVKRIKRLIVGTVIVLILVPTICCIGLLLKVRQLEKQIKNFQFGRLNIEESLVDFDTVEVSNVSSVVLSQAIPTKSIENIKTSESIVFKCRIFILLLKY